MLRLKRTHILILLVGAFLILFIFPKTGQAEEITDFSVRMNISKNGILEITEIINYDFGNLERHGIFRNIPYLYQRNGFKYNIRIKVSAVLDENENVRIYKTKRKGSDIEIKIGDPDKLITGKQTYIIKYTVERAINWFDNEPEIYWNVTGNEWPVRINNASVGILSEVGVSQDKATCYTGTFQSQEQKCEFKSDLSSVKLQIVTQDLSAYEGLSFAIRLPKGSILKPGLGKNISWFLTDNWGFGLPIFALVFLIYMYRQYGRDPKSRGTIIAQYNPPKKMSPAMLGYLIDEKIDTRDVSAAIINLAVLGNLKIIYQDKTIDHTYKLEKIKEAGKDLSKFESDIFNEIFKDKSKIELKDLKSTLPLKLREFKDDLRKEAQTQKYFKKTPENVRSSYLGFGILGIFGGLATIIFYQAALGIGLMITGVLFFAFSNFMPQKTEKGVILAEEIKGFKLYLTVAEKDRVKFHMSPKNKPEQFFSYLPFAMALAVEKEWANQFKDITLEQPEWYTGQSFTYFNTVVFAKALTDFSSTTKFQALTAARSAGSGGSGFSGGGFSGGGFGGGGGGSW